MNWLAKTVPLSGIYHQLTGHVMVVQGTKELSRLRKRNHRIHFTMNPQRRCPGILYKLNQRATELFLNQHYAKVKNRQESRTKGQRVPIGAVTVVYIATI